MVLYQKSAFSMPLSSLIIFIWISITTLEVMASKNLWDTIGETADPKDDLETYEKNLCSNPLIDCYGCQQFNDDSANCRLQPDCWYNCEASKCLNITEFDEKYTCSQYCGDECHCFEEPNCYYIYAAKKCDFVEQCHDGAYDLKKNFEANDCIRGSSLNTYHLIGGSACASDVGDDTGNCEEDNIGFELQHSPKQPGLKSEVVTPKDGARPNGSYEYRLTINKVDWDAGDFQLYNMSLQGEPMVVKLRKADFKDRSVDVRIVVHFVTKEGQIFIRGYKGPQTLTLEEGTTITVGSLSLTCSNVGDEWNKFDKERFRFFKNP